MGFYTDHVLPRVIHLVLGNLDFAALRREYLGDIEGTVREIGFGSGLSLPFYSPAVLRLYAVEPSDVAWRLAGTAVEGVRFPVERIGLSAEAIPLPDLAVDAVDLGVDAMLNPGRGQGLTRDPADPQARRRLPPRGARPLPRGGSRPLAMAADWDLPVRRSGSPIPQIDTSV